MEKDSFSDWRSYCADTSSIPGLKFLRSDNLHTVHVTVSQFGNMIRAQWPNRKGCLTPDIVRDPDLSPTIHEIWVLHGLWPAAQQGFHGYFEFLEGLIRTGRGLESSSAVD